MVVVQVAEGWFHASLLINVVKARKRAADADAPRRRFLVELRQIAVKLGLGKDAIICLAQRHRWPIKRPNAGRKFVIFSEKSGKISGCESRENGGPAIGGHEITRPKIQQ